MSFQTTSELKEEFIKRAKAANLQVQCAMDGTIHAEVAVIAEAPGEREVIAGRPLVGGSGMKLWEIGKQFGLNRQQLYITNVCKRQVSLANDQRNPVNRHELDLWSSLLQWELSQLPNLKYIIVLGGMSLKAITGNEGITGWRGSVLQNVKLSSVDRSRSVDVLCTYNPAAIIRDPKLEITFMADLGKFPKLVKGEWVIKPWNVHINPSYSDAMDYLNDLEANAENVAYDTETIANETDRKSVV